MLNESIDNCFIVLPEKVMLSNKVIKVQVSHVGSLSKSLPERLLARLGRPKDEVNLR